MENSNSVFQLETAKNTKNNKHKKYSDKTRINDLSTENGRERLSDEVNLSLDENSCHWLFIMKAVPSNEHNEDWNKHTLFEIHDAIFAL